MTITNGYTTLAKVTALLDITTTDTGDDGVIEDMITQASRIIDRITGRTFYARTETRYFDVPPDRMLELDDDLISITTLTNGDSTVLTTASDYYLLPSNDSPKWAVVLKESSSNRWTWDSSNNRERAITIAGTWGFTTDTPPDIEAACLEIVVHAYRRRFGDNMTGIATVTAAGVVITPDSIPSKALLILRPYIRMV